MKYTTATMTALITALFVLSPLAASAATGSVSVHTDTTSYSGAHPITVMVTATGFTSLSGQSAALTVTNPNGVAVFSEPSDISSGTATAQFTTGGSSAWISGTYVVTANVEGVIGSTTFSYTCNGSSCSGGSSDAKALAEIQGNLTQIEQTLATLSSQHTAEDSAIAALQADVTNLQTTLSASGPIQTSLTNLAAQVQALNTQVQAANTAAQAANTAAQAAEAASTSASNNVSSTQTYVLVLVREGRFARRERRMCPSGFGRMARGVGFSSRGRRVLVTRGARANRVGVKLRRPLFSGTARGAGRREPAGL